MGNLEGAAVPHSEEWLSFISSVAPLAMYPESCRGAERSRSRHHHPAAPTASAGPAGGRRDRREQDLAHYPPEYAIVRKGAPSLPLASTRRERCVGGVECDLGRGAGAILATPCSILIRSLAESQAATDRPSFRGRGRVRLLFDQRGLQQRHGPRKILQGASSPYLDPRASKVWPMYPPLPPPPFIDGLGAKIGLDNGVHFRKNRVQD